MKYIIFTSSFFLCITQLYAQRATIQYAGHETAVSYSFYENDTLYLGLANSKDYRGNYYDSSSFFKQVKLTEQNNVLWQSAPYSAVDSTVPSIINATFFKKDSLYVAMGSAVVSASPELQQIAYYVGKSPEIDSLRFLPSSYDDLVISGGLPHPTNDSILLFYGVQVFIGSSILFKPFIMEFNFYTEAQYMHIYENNPNYMGSFEELLFDKNQNKYLALPSLPLPPNTATKPSPATAFAYLDTNFVLDTTNLISSTIGLSYSNSMLLYKNFTFGLANMLWLTDSTIIMVGQVFNPSVIQKPAGSKSDFYENDIAVSIRDARDFSEIDTTKVYGKKDVGETANWKEYPFIRMDSNLFIAASTLEYDGHYMGSPWDTELALLGSDTNGNKHWMYYFPYNDYCEVDNILPDEKGGLWVVSQCSNADATGGDWFVDVMYLDSVVSWPRNGQSTGLTEKDNLWDKKIKLFPNPADEKITIRQYGKPMVLDAVIYDVNGRQVKKLKVGDANSSFDVSELNAGIYFVRIGIGERILATKKLMVR